MWVILFSYFLRPEQRESGREQTISLRIGARAYPGGPTRLAPAKRGEHLAARPAVEIAPVEPSRPLILQQDQKAGVDVVQPDEELVNARAARRAAKGRWHGAV